MHGRKTGSGGSSAGGQQLSGGNSRIPASNYARMPPVGFLPPRLGLSPYRSNLLGQLPNASGAHLSPQNEAAYRMLLSRFLATSAPPPPPLPLAGTPWNNSPPSGTVHPSLSRFCIPPLSSYPHGSTGSSSSNPSNSPSNTTPSTPAPSSETQQQQSMFFAPPFHGPPPAFPPVNPFWRPPTFFSPQGPYPFYYFPSYTPTMPVPSHRGAAIPRNSILALYGLPAEAVSIRSRPLTADREEIRFFLSLFRRDLLYSDKSIALLARGYSQNRWTNWLLDVYFCHLHSRLLKYEPVFGRRPDLFQHIIDSTHYPFDDFATYGGRFKAFLEHLNLNQSTKAYYGGLLEIYCKLIPDDVATFRRSLLQILANEETDEASGQSCCPLDHEMITYRVVNARDLYKSLLAIANIDEQIDFFLSNIHLSQYCKDNLDRFIGVLEHALSTSGDLAHLGPKVHPFGSLSSGLAAYDTDLDLVVHFEAAPQGPVDYETAVLALEVLQKVLQAKLNFATKENRILPYRRCPIIRLDFAECFSALRTEVRELNHSGSQNGVRLELSSADISVSSLYGLHNSRLLQFFTILEPRFYELTMILKYWIRRNGLIHTEALSSYALTLMVVFFLQTRQPPLLPSVELLQALAIERTTVGSVVVSFCDSIERVRSEWTPEENHDPTNVLVVEFLRYYYNFNYLLYAITPLTGRLTSKNSLFMVKRVRGINTFKPSYICIEDPLVLDQNVGANFRDRYKARFKDTFVKVLFNQSISPLNCLTVLTNPALFTVVPLKEDDGGSVEEFDSKLVRNGNGRKAK